MISLPDQPPGNQRLGDFEIVREVGRGGMGVVYEARQVSLNRKVALKILSGGLGLTARAVQRFHREAEAAARLHHTNIVPVYATGEAQGSHFYAMELIEGPSLHQVIRQMRQAREGTPPAVATVPEGAVPPKLIQTGPYEPSPAESPSAAGLSSSHNSDGPYFDTVARMVAEVADALEYAHQQGVIHRDIKPSNLLLSPAGRLSVNDFGLARVLEQPGMTLTGEFVGTPAYMSPEQITADRIPLDHRTDIYSLGATLYELLTLEPPFKGQSREQVLAQIVQKEPRPPRRVNREVPRDLETICLKCLEKDPDRRYQTAGQLAEDLRRYLNRFAIAARRAGPIERLAKWVKRHPGLAAALAAVVVALGVAGFFAQQAWRGRQERIAGEEAARRELLDEKMQQAQNHVLQGDFSRAEEFIRTAEELGAPEEWAQWRRGQIAYHRAQFERAIALLEPAAERMPDNVGLTCLLASAWVFGGNEKYVPILEHLDSLTPRTAEDFLYKGLMESLLDGVKGLKTLDEAMTRQPSLIAHVLRAQVRSDHAMDTTDLASIEGAVEDATAAKSILRGNSSALTTSVWVQMHAAGLYALSGKPKERAAALGIARKDAAELARFPELPFAVWVRGLFLQYDGQEEEALKVWENGVRQKEVGLLVAQGYAFELYRRGEVEKAVKIIEVHFPARSSFFRDYERAFLLAELPNGPARAREIYDRLIARYPEFSFELVMLLLWLGKKEEANAALRALDLKLASPLDQECGAYLRNPGVAAAEKLVRAAGRSKRKQLEAHVTIGITLLADGDRPGARRHFEACLATHCIPLAYYQWSRAFLGRMDRDPAWPRWIPQRR